MSTIQRRIPCSTGVPIGRRDVAITVVVSLLGLLLMYFNVQDPEVEASVLAIPVFLLVTVPLLWRRAAPTAAAAGLLAGLLLHLALFGTDVVRCGVVLPSSFLIAFAAGVNLERRPARVALLVASGAIVTESAYFLGSFGVVVVGAAVLWGTGRVVRSRGRMIGELKQREVELREARDERARMEVATDRARISAELDELLQRRLGELARLADAGAAADDPDAATAALVGLEHESRRTLEQMRAVVGILREDDFTVPTAPQPTFTYLEAMLVRAKGAGARLTVEGDQRVLPAAVELSACRIVEHLLAALADTPEVDVRVRFSETALELAVSGPTARDAKAALARARERALLHHGTLVASTRGGRAEATASLPVLVPA